MGGTRKKRRTVRKVRRRSLSQNILRIPREKGTRRKTRRRTRCRTKRRTRQRSRQRTRKMLGGAQEEYLHAARSNVTGEEGVGSPLTGKVKKYMGMVVGGRYKERDFVLKVFPPADPEEESFRLVLEIFKGPRDMKDFYMIDKGDLTLTVTDTSITQTNRSIKYDSKGELTITTPERSELTLKISGETGHANDLRKLWRKILGEARDQEKHNFELLKLIAIFESRILDYETKTSYGGDTYAHRQPRELSLHCNSDGKELHIRYSGKSGKMKTVKISDDPLNCQVKCLYSGIEFTLPSGKTLTVKRPHGSDGFPDGKTFDRSEKVKDFLKLRCCLWYYCSGTFMDTKMFTVDPLLFPSKVLPGDIIQTEIDQIEEDLPRTLGGIFIDDDAQQQQQIRELLHKYVKCKDVPEHINRAGEKLRYTQGMNDFMGFMLLNKDISILGESISDLTRAPLFLRSIYKNVFQGKDGVSCERIFRKYFDALPQEEFINAWTSVFNISNEALLKEYGHVPEIADRPADHSKPNITVPLVENIKGDLTRGLQYYLIRLSKGYKLDQLLIGRNLDSSGVEPKLLGVNRAVSMALLIVMGEGGLPDKSYGVNPREKLELIYDEDYKPPYAYPYDETGKYHKLYEWICSIKEDPKGVYTSMYTSAKITDGGPQSRE